MTLPTGTKYDILKLLVRQELSAQSLAEALGVSPTAVRQHLETLKALGLVQRRTLITQPSRPTYLYRLSTAGRSAFPKRYDLLLGLVVDVMLERQGPDVVSDVVRAAATRLAGEVRERFERTSEHDRWDVLVGWLESELAWQAEASGDAGERRIAVYQCPFQDVARRHPTVCGVFFSTLVRALYGDVPVEMDPAPTPPACCALRIGR